MGFGGNGGNGDGNEHTSTDEYDAVEAEDEDDEEGAGRDSGGCGAFLLTIGVLIMTDGTIGGGGGGKLSSLMLCIIFYSHKLWPKQTYSQTDKVNLEHCLSLELY